MDLGGNIELVGFKEIDSENMAIIKKRVSNFLKDYANIDAHFQRLVITLKRVHEREDHQVFELQAKLSGKDVLNTDVNDRNLLVALDKALKKLQAQVEKRMHA